MYGGYGPYVENRGFAKMFWGELFVFLDVRLGGFDIFPDLAGLILIVAGVYQLSAYQEHFESLRGIVVLRLILSAGDIISVDRLGVSPRYTLLLGFLLYGIGLALSLLYYYHSLMGIYELANVYQPELAEAARSRWPPVLLCSCLGHLFSFLTQLSDSFFPLALLSGIAMLVLAVSFMSLLWQSYKKLR